MLLSACVSNGWLTFANFWTFAWAAAEVPCCRAQLDLCLGRAPLDKTLVGHLSFAWAKVGCWSFVVDRLCSLYQKERLERAVETWKYVSCMALLAKRDISLHACRNRLRPLAPKIFGPLLPKVQKFKNPNWIQKSKSEVLAFGRCEKLRIWYCLLHY